VDILPREAKILQLFHPFPYLTDTQALHLLAARGIYKLGSAKAISAKLKRFTEENYLYRTTPLVDIVGGSAFYVYWLGAKGRHYLADEYHYDFSEWRHPSRMTDFVKSSHVWHCLGVTDFLIAASYLPHVNNHIQIKTMFHDFTLKREMQGCPVIPDGLIKFASGDEPCIWLELDRDTEKEEAFTSKLRRIIALMGHGFDEWFETPLALFTWAFVTPLGEHRVGEMRTACEKLLHEMKHEQLGEKFLFAYLPTSCDPHHVFLSPVWEMPFQSHKYPLFAIE